MNRLWRALLPDLQRFPAADQEKALQKARDAALESPELIGIAIWLVLVTALTRYILVQTSASTDVWATLVVNLVFTAPLLIAVYVPIHVRRLRRGLKKQLDQQGRS